MTVKSDNPNTKGIKHMAFAARDAEAAPHKPLTSLNLVFVRALNTPAQEVRHDYRH
ncbi:MAG: hypothetical protein AAFX92_16945 [Pseudomonadota bacterium]